MTKGLGCVRAYVCVGREENVQRAARCDSLLSLSLLSRRSYVASTSIESV